MPLCSDRMQIRLELDLLHRSCDCSAEPVWYSEREACTVVILWRNMH